MHANTMYAYTIFACDGSMPNPCSSKCSDVTDTADTASTARERWLVTGVRGYNQDTERRVVDLPGAGSPASLRFQAGPHDKEIGIYFNTGGLWLTRNQDTAWDTDWNSASWSTPLLLMEGTGPDNQGDFDAVKDPDVLTRADGRVVMLFTVEDTDTDDTEDTAEGYSILSLPSADTAGNDWGVACFSDPGCASTRGCEADTADTATRQCDILERAEDLGVVLHAGGENCLEEVGMHGHVAWDYLAGDGLWDPETEPLTRFITGTEDTDCGAACDGCSSTGTSDVNRLDWDTNEEVFSLAEQEESGDGCPYDVIPDRHDPALTPHPGGEFKIYSKVTQDHWVLGYLPDAVGTVEDTSNPEFYFEDSGLTGEPGAALNAGCVEDPTTLIWKRGSEIHEVMFFTAPNGEPNKCFYGYPGGILAAVLYND